MLLSIPSLTFSVIFNRDTSHMGFLYILSIVFAIKIIRYLVISRCIRAYHMKRSLKLPAVSLFWAFIKPSLVHIPLVGLPAILAAGAAGDLKSSAIGIGAGLCMVLISYIFAIDVPFRIKSDIKDFSQ